MRVTNTTPPATGQPLQNKVIAMRQQILLFGAKDGGNGRPQAGRKHGAGQAAAE